MLADFRNGDSYSDGILDKGCSIYILAVLVICQVTEAQALNGGKQKEE